MDYCMSIIGIIILVIGYITFELNEGKKLK